MSAQQVFEDHYLSLVKSLPMDDSIFIAALLSEHLLPGDSRRKIKSLSTAADKASHFLDEIIEPSLIANDLTMLEKLLTVMENYGVEKLACTIRSALQHGSPSCSQDTGCTS